MSDPDPSYVGLPGAVNGYVNPGYQKYYSTESGVAPGTPPDIGIPPMPPPTPPGWPTLPPTLPPVGCPPLASTWAPGPVDSGGNQMSYTPPVYVSNDDGLAFPASMYNLVLVNQWHGTASALDPINLEIYRIQLRVIIENAIAQANATKEVNFPAIGGTASGTITMPITPFRDIEAAVQIAVLKAQQQGHNLWYELVLKPVTNGPFASAYVIESTPLQIPKTIDLSAPSMT